MKKCKSCQTEIDDKAKKCPHCQTDQRNWFAKHPILTVVIVLIVIGIFGSSGGKSKSGTSNTPVEQGANQPQSEKTEVTAEKVDVTDFADEFDANQVAAEAKWGGKLIEFSAKISNITDSGISFYDVASKEFSGAQISCKIVDKQQLMSLKNGQVVTVRGVVGTQTIGVIGVDDCQVVE